MRACGVLAALALAAPPIARAATLDVPADYPTAGAAFTAAAAGDTVRLAPGRYPESALLMPGGVTLLGPAEGDEAWFDGSDAGAAILTVSPGAARVRIERVAFRNAAPALRVSAGPDRHEVLHCAFHANRGAVDGAGFDVRGCRFEDNPAPPIAAIDAAIDSCVFHANPGGAVRGSKLRITGSRFEAHPVTAVAGEFLLVEDCVFLANSTREAAGAIDMAPGTVRRCTFEGNEAAAGGGAIRAEGGEITDCTFVANRATKGSDGGAVHLVASTPVTGCLFLRNEAEGDGGAIFARDRTTTVDGCRFLGNRAARGGGVLVAGAHLLVRHSTFLRNAAEKGGAIYAPTVSRRTLALETTVIQETLSGGAIAALPAAFAPSLVACNLFGNAGGDWTERIADQYPGNGNLSVDGMFCADPEDSLFIAATSPLLAVNNRAGVDIGASRAACHAPGVLVTSDPVGVPLAVDGVVHGAPAVFAWTPGSEHTLAAPVRLEPGDGVRHDFIRWSDGGAAEHTVTAPDGDARFTASYTRSFRVATHAEPGGSVEPVPDFVPQGTAVTLHAVPEPGAVFAGWTGAGEGAYTGALLSPTITVAGPVTQLAHFYRPPEDGRFSLTVTGTEGGRVWPASGSYAPGEHVEIVAAALTGYRFVKWVGGGQDSYSGEATHATVVFHSDVTQHALFERDETRHGAEFSLSASATDPFVNTAPPTGGPRDVHLWLTCSEGGISALECGVFGSIPFGAFMPAEGVLNFGSDTDLILVMDECPTGESVNRRLGQWIVNDTGGRICLAPSRAHRVFVTVDCGDLPNEWPDPFARGFASDGPPCETGTNGCGGTMPSTAAPRAAMPRHTGLTAVAPNPFRSWTEVRFRLAQPGPAAVTLYDVAGRLVRVLRAGDLPAGDHAATWDGRGNSGPVAGGIYFVRLEAGERRETRRVVFLGGARGDP